MIIKLQENIIKCEQILKDFENDSFYKFIKAFVGKGKFENTIRNINNESIELRNKIVVDIMSAINSTEYKLDVDKAFQQYFNDIINASSKESLSFVHLNSITLPPTLIFKINQDEKIINVLNSISQNITAYNNRISHFRQIWNKFKIVIHYFPSIENFPEILNGQINLINLIQSQTNIPIPNRKVKSVPVISQKNKVSNSPKSNAQNITNKF